MRRERHERNDESRELERKLEGLRGEYDAAMAPLVPIWDEIVGRVAQRRIAGGASLVRHSHEFHDAAGVARDYHPEDFRVMLAGMRGRLQVEATTEARERMLKILNSQMGALIELKPRTERRLRKVLANPMNVLSITLLAPLLSEDENRTIVSPRYYPVELSGAACLRIAEEQGASYAIELTECYTSEAAVERWQSAAETIVGTAVLPSAGV